MHRARLTMMQPRNVRFVIIRSASFAARKSGAGGNLAGGSQAGRECALHPAGPGGQVLSGKMDSAFRLHGYRIKRGELAWQVEGECPACPWSLAPAPGEAALEVCAHAWVHPLGFGDPILDTLIRLQVF